MTDPKKKLTRKEFKKAKDILDTGVFDPVLVEMLELVIGRIKDSYPEARSYYTQIIKYNLNLETVKAKRKI
jgi:hypothetical protein